MGKSTGLKLGMGLIVLQLFGLGSLKFVDSYGLFVGLAILAQCLGGIGAGINTTCAVAIITTSYPDEREQNLGILEGGTGLGLLLGPLLGGLLFYLGGYLAPYWTVGTICVLILPLLQRTIIEINAQEQVNEAKRNVLAYAEELEKATNLLDAIRDAKIETPRHRRARSDTITSSFFSATHAVENDSLRNLHMPIMHRRVGSQTHQTEFEEHVCSQTYDDELDDDVHYTATGSTSEISFRDIA